MLDTGAVLAHVPVMSTPADDHALSAPAPEDCRDMRDVRAGVDAVDRVLVKLIARRQAYMDAAARIKPDREAVRDEARIAEVLAKVQAEAWEQGLSWAIAEPVWRAMIEACIAHEFEAFDNNAERTAAGM